MVKNVDGHPEKQGKGGGGRVGGREEGWGYPSLKNTVTARTLTCYKDSAANSH